MLEGRHDPRQHQLALRARRAALRHRRRGAGRDDRRGRVRARARRARVREPDPDGRVEGPAADPRLRRRAALERRRLHALHRRHDRHAERRDVAARGLLLRVLPGWQPARPDRAARADRPQRDAGLPHGRARARPADARRRAVAHAHRPLRREQADRVLRAVVRRGEGARPRGRASARHPSGSSATRWRGRWPRPRSRTPIGGICPRCSPSATAARCSAAR